MNRARNTRELVELSSHGDETALSALLAENLAAMLAFVRLNASDAVRAHESCADIVQSVCREVLEADLAGFDYRGEAAFRNWLFTRTLNKLRNRERYYFAGKRDVRRTVRVAQPEVRDGLARLYAAIATPSENAEVAEAVAQLEAAFAQLANEDRAILSMSRIVGLSHAEIAAELGLKEGTVRVRLHRALARIGTIMHVAGSEPRD